MTDATAWKGQVGDTWAEEWRRTDRSFADLDPHLHAAIAATAPNARTIVDLGSGAGATGLAVAAARSEARVTGIDLSRALVAVARARGEGLSNLGFRLGDAATGAAAMAPVDLYISRHGVMFFPDPVAAFAQLHESAAPSAALVFSCFAAREQNEWAEVIGEAVGELPPLVPGAPGPFAFDDPDRVAAILGDAGWRDPTPASITFRYLVGVGPDPVADALAFFRRIGPAAPLLRAAPPGERTAMEERLAAVLRERVTEGKIDFAAAAWLWSARA